MDRRGFLGAMVGGISLAAARTWPFRVYSFPSEIKFPVVGRVDRIEQAVLLPGGMMLDGDRNVIARNNSDYTVILQRSMYVKEGWECKNGIAIIEGTNA